jgi:hypothetical protein
MCHKNSMTYLFLQCRKEIIYLKYQPKVSFSSEFGMTKFIVLYQNTLLTELLTCLIFKL